MSRSFPKLVVGVAILAVGVCAQAQNAPAPVPPPPSINDPGVKPAAASTAPAPAARSLKGVPDLPAMGGSDGAQRDGLGQPPPTMNLRTVGKDKVEEYRVNGRLYMIHVIPEHGIPQTYMVNPEGEVMRQPGQPPVKPVYYTIYKWGGPKKKKDGDSQ